LQIFLTLIKIIDTLFAMDIADFVGPVPSIIGLLTKLTDLDLGKWDTLEHLDY